MDLSATSANDQEKTDNGISNSTQTEAHWKWTLTRISVIALGGTLGNGIFINLQYPLIEAGPVNSLTSFIFMGILIYSVTQSAGEMTAHSVVPFPYFNNKYLSKAIGFATTFCYWLSWAAAFGLELFSFSQIILYWTHAVPTWAWILIGFVLITFANLISARFYHEFEFWCSLIKLTALVGFLIYAFCMVCGAGKTGPVGFRYWRNPGPWGPGVHLVENINTDRFLGWLSSLINAAFTYQGCELIGATACSSSNHKKSAPIIINKVIIGMLVLYIGSLFACGLLVPYNDPGFDDESQFISQSPFLIAIKNSGTPVLNHILNAVMLVILFSECNSSVYIGSNILYDMAGITVFSFFKRTNRYGSPYISVLATAAFGLLAFLTLSNKGDKVFNWLLNITALAAIITWISISASHIRFMHILRSKGISRDSLPYKAKLMPGLAWFTVIALAIIAFIQGYWVFFNFDLGDFFSSYVSLIFFVVLWIGSQLTIYQKEPCFIAKNDICFDSESSQIDDEVSEGVENKGEFRSLSGRALSPSQ